MSVFIIYFGLRHSVELFVNSHARLPNPQLSMESPVCAFHLSVGAAEL